MGVIQPSSPEENKLSKITLTLPFNGLDIFFSKSLHAGNQIPLLHEQTNSIRLLFFHERKDFAQNYKFSNENHLFPAWRDLKKI